MNKIYKKLLLRLMQTRIYSDFIMKIVPFVRFSVYYTSLRGWKYYRGYKFLKKGDIIVTVDKKKLTGMLIPGTWTHALWVIDVGMEDEVVEMTHTNYTFSNFFDACKEADRVAILRCEDFDAEYIEKFIQALFTLRNSKYDVKFELGVKALYCSELGYQADKIAGNGQGRMILDLSDIANLGVEYISPDGLAAGKNIRRVWDSDWETR